MNSKHVQVLATLLATNSTIATARKVGLSQSGVSRILHTVEDELGLTLFHRDKGRLIPTPEALALGQDVDSVVRSFERLSSNVENLKNGAAVPDIIRLGLPGSMWENLAPKVLAEHGKMFPNACIETYFTTTTAVPKLIEDRVIDFGFVRMDAVAPPGVECEPITSSENVCVMPEGHQLASFEKITPKLLVGAPLVLIGRGGKNRLSLDQTFAAAGVKQFVKIETHTASSACAYAVNGLGIAIVSGFFASLYSHLPVVIRPFSPSVRQEFGLAAWAGSPMSIATRACYDLLKERVSSWAQP
jgi:DNA-binding transcriptional LysR family regulator